MIKNLFSIITGLLLLAPYILLIFRNQKVNLKKEIRSRQYPMPVLALIYCIALMLLLAQLNDAVMGLITRFADTLYGLSDSMTGLFSFLGGILSWLGGRIKDTVRTVEPVYILFYVENTLILLLHIILKRIIIIILAALVKPGTDLHDRPASLAYYKDDKSDDWFLKPELGQARTFLKSAYLCGAGISLVIAFMTRAMYRDSRLTGIYFPVFAVIILGELYFAIDGVTADEANTQFEGEKGSRTAAVDFRTLRGALKKLFGDKLLNDDTVVAAPALLVAGSNDEMLFDYESSDDPKKQAYGAFMRRCTLHGLSLDANLLKTGAELLDGRSVLFCDPFWYDLIPYIFYPANRALLAHRKVLIVLGRHGTEEGALKWCEEGFCAVNGIPYMWRTGVLAGDDGEEELDVGIMTRSAVNDPDMHAANSEFLRDVGFVILLEPSRLITGAQVGLSSVIRFINEGGGRVTYASSDKNCDGLLDALSHILMTDLREVSATKRADGISSYMCWDPDNDRLQHRLLPNISRYLGVGTELSFAGLKNGAVTTEWYGGDAFPVVDMRWIAGQYYYDLLSRAGLPPVQEGMDEHFILSHALWEAKKGRDRFITVEDESFNMYEMRRTFSTRSDGQGFVNVISPPYLLRDYMAENSGIFNADPKAIPYVTADYAHTPRNVALRLCMRMTCSPVPKRDLGEEIKLLAAPGDDCAGALWNILCEALGADPEKGISFGDELFTRDVIEEVNGFSVYTGKIETVYRVTNKAFTAALLRDLQSAKYVAEDEREEKETLGAELYGQIFQQHLPGQFFTLSGKYFEMVRMTPDGRVVIRRAADHITGRPTYRQIRRYALKNVSDSDVMGDSKTVSGFRIKRQYADITVNTPAYYELPAFNDFENARRVEVNNIPERRYLRKQILKIELPEELSPTPEIYKTATLLINEIMKTLFAENAGFISAVFPGEAEIPITYSLETEDNAPAIYFIEDSQLDVGLLEAVERNLDRIFRIACDYIEWHKDALEKSIDPEADKPEPYVPPVPRKKEEKEEERGVKGFIKKLTGRLKEDKEGKKARRERKKAEKEEKKKRARLPEEPEKVPAPEVPGAPAPEEAETGAPAPEETETGAPAPVE
ncbi:MAG: hypothetical protein IJS65_00955, partial [Clostridia bacterium]|nr:hypothetical protein [Clostridia bacterium]